jgi:hypothetical protein
MREWFVCQNGDASNIVGPLDSAKVVQGILSGKLSRDSLVARPGDNNWQGVMEVAEIRTELARLELDPAPAKPVDAKPADAKPPERKDDKPPAPPDPRLKTYPRYIFGACAALSLILLIIGLLK